MKIKSIKNNISSNVSAVDACANCDIYRLFITNAYSAYTASGTLPAVIDNDVSPESSRIIDRLVLLQYERQKKLNAAYDHITYSQLLIKQLLEHHVHYVKHPMANIEGLLTEVANLSCSGNDEFMLFLKYIDRNFKELKESYVGLTEKLEKALFPFEINEINLKTAFLRYVKLMPAGNEISLQFNIHKGGSKLSYCDFTLERLVKELFAYLSAMDFDNDRLDILITSKKLKASHIISICLKNKVVISDQVIRDLGCAIKMFGKIGSDTRSNPVAYASGIISSYGGDLGFSYTNNNIQFDLRLPLNFNNMACG